MVQSISCLLTLKEARDSVRSVLHNILIECDDPVKFFRLINTCLSVTTSDVRMSTRLLMLLDNDPRGAETCHTLGVIPHLSVLVGSITKFLQYAHDDKRNCKIYLHISLFGLKQTDVLSPLLYNLSAHYTSKNVKRSRIICS